MPAREQGAGRMSIELLATSIADRAYDRIRADIVFGRLAPGATASAGPAGE